MKFTAVALASLAAVTAVSAIPTSQSQFEVFTRRSDNELFVRYSDVIAYLKARDQDEGSTQGLTQPLAGQSTGKGGDAGAGASGSDSTPSQQTVKGLNDPPPPVTHHRPSHHHHHHVFGKKESDSPPHHHHHVFGKQDSDSPMAHHHSHHHHVFGKKDSDSPATPHHSHHHHHHGYGQDGSSSNGPSHKQAAAFKSPWAPSQSDDSKPTKTPATDLQARGLRLYRRRGHGSVHSHDQSGQESQEQTRELYRRRHGHSASAAAHGHDQSTQSAGDSQDSRRR